MNYEEMGVGGITKLIEKHIRKLCCKTILFSSVVIAAIVIAFICIPFYDMYYPKSVKNIDQTNITALKNLKYIDASADLLYYSGYDYYRGEHKTGSLYYTLNHNTCTFIMISSEGKENTPEIIEHYNGKAAITKNNYVVEQTIEAMAKDLSWNSKDLANFTSAYYLDELGYDPFLYYILFGCLIVLLISLIIHMFIHIIYVLRPLYHPACRRLKRYGNTEQLIRMANTQLFEYVDLRCNDIFITSDFFIELGRNEIVILPISKIKWIYRIGTWKPFFFIRLKRVYHLHLMAEKRLKLIISGKQSSVTSEILEYFQKYHDRMLIGYSESHKKMVKQLM